MFLGYDMTSTGFRVLILSTLKVAVSDEVKFEEDESEGLTSPELSTMSALPVFPFAKQSTITRNGDLGDHPTVESPLPVTKFPAAESQVTKQQNLPSLGEHAVDPLPLTDLQNTVQNTEPSEDNLDNVTTALERRYPLRNRKPKKFSR